MKKVLNEVCAKAAFAVAALTTVMFTSCEKESFNVAFDQNPAKVVISPTVIDAATNVNVTANATFSDNLIITGNKDIAAQDVEVTATVNGVTGKTIVKVGAVAAGQIVTFSPTILLSSEFEFTAVEGTEWYTGVEKKFYGTAAGGAEAASKAIKHDTPDHSGETVWEENATEFMVEFEAAWKLTAIAPVTWTGSDNIQSVDLKKALEEGVPVKNEGKETLQASAWSIFTALYTVAEAYEEYTVTSKASGENVGTVEVKNPIYEVTVEAVEKAHPNHAGHYVHGHGAHGNGSNAGGGIILAD